MNNSFFISLLVKMEKQLKCVLLLSLKEMALRRMVVLLWSGSDVLAPLSELNQFFFHERNQLDESVDKKVKDKVLQLELPELLLKQMIDIIRPIGEEIKRWKESHSSVFSHSPDLSKLCWTAAGTIDLRKTAEELLRCNVRCGRYEIACYYCLEDYIPLLWEELNETEKEIFGNVRHLSPDLHFCWPHILKGEYSNLNYLMRISGSNPSSFNQYAFEHAADKGNKAAVAYFFKNLTQEEKEVSLVRTAYAVIKNPNLLTFRDETLSDVLCYLLSLMTPEQQMGIVNARPIEVLLSFLDWSRRDLFLVNADLIWTILPASFYGDLINKMGEIYGHSNRYFPKLFQEFFLQSPPDFKRYLVDVDPEIGCIRVHYFLSVLMDFNDLESIEVIFRNMDSAERVRLVFHYDILNLFCLNILIDKWDVVEVCLREATLSREDRERLKEAFTEYLKRQDRGRFVAGKGKWKRFYEFLGVTYANANEKKNSLKRKLGNCSSE